MTHAPRTSVITDWRVRDENDLPDVPPGEEYERSIRPQTFVVLRWILVQDLSLARLRIGAVEEVPFELESTEGNRSAYRPKGLDDEALKKRLAAAGAAVAHGAIAVPPGMDVIVVLRNDRNVPAKPRVALMVNEEVAR